MTDAATRKEKRETRSKGRAFLFFLLGTVIALACAALGWWYFVKHQSTGLAQGSAREEELTPPAQEEGVLMLEPFLVNLADSYASRYLRLAVALRLRDKTMAEEVRKDHLVMARLRDGILTLLSTKSSRDLLTREGKGKLREEIKAKAETILPQGSVKEVLFTDMIMQL